MKDNDAKKLELIYEASIGNHYLPPPIERWEGRNEADVIRSMPNEYYKFIVDENGVLQSHIKNALERGPEDPEKLINAILMPHGFMFTYLPGDEETYPIGTIRIVKK